MKKLAILVGAIALTSSTFAQNDTWGSDKKKDKSKDKSGTMSNSSSLATNKKGMILNPEAGDWSIGVDATPFINFAADLVHIGAAQTGAGASPTFNGQNNSAPTWSVSGKYFRTNNLAYRGTVRLNFQNDKTSRDIDYNTDFTAAPVNWPNDVTKFEEQDKMKTNNWSVGLAGGLEWRKGTKRLQGYYGAELALAFAQRTDKYNYAYDVTAMDAANGGQDAMNNYTTDFGGNTTYAADHDERTLSDKGGFTSAFGIRGFVGVEFFVAPKISLGGEFGWGLGINHTGRGTSTSEGIDYLADDGTALDGTVVNDVETRGSDATTEFFLGMDRTKPGANESALWMNSFSPQGNLSLNFYF